MKLKINTDLGVYKKGDVLEIITDKDCVPIESFWRARLKDSKIDNCIEIIKSKKTNKRVK